VSVNLNSSKSLLLLGATSSLSRPIISLARAANWQVDVTVRDSDKILPSEVLNVFELNLSNKTSIEAFLENTNLRTYYGCISLLGATSSFSSPPNYRDLVSYYETHCTNYFYLLEQMILVKNRIQTDGRLMVLGSRASVYGSFDLHYAAVKAALAGFALSLNRHTKTPSVTCIAPSLIIGSKMYDSMDLDSRESHNVRSGNMLIDVDSACIQIWNLFCDTSSKSQLPFVEIGPSYL